MREVKECTTIGIEKTHLRCHKFGCATECARRAAIPHLFLAQSVIGDFDVSIKSEQNVIKLQITDYGIIMLVSPVLSKIFITYRYIIPFLWKYSRASRTSEA